MGSFDWVLELVLVGLLGVTLIHAIRLERALGKLRNDRAALGEAIAGFDDSTRQAELGLGRMQAIATESVQLINKRVDQASRLKDDLLFLTERGEGLADRLDALVRAAKAAAPPAPPAYPAPEPRAPTPSLVEPAIKVRSQAERELLQALRNVQ